MLYEFKHLEEQCVDQEIAKETSIQIQRRFSDAIDKLASARFEAILVLQDCEVTNLYKLFNENKDFLVARQVDSKAASSFTEALCRASL